MEKDNTEIESTNVGMASAVSDGIAQQVDAHSKGLLFSQSVNQQQNSFNLGISTSTLDVKKILELKQKQNAVVGKRRSRFE